MRLCIPVETKEGLQSRTYGHFGSAPCFLIYDTDKKAAKTVANDSAHHSHGMCHPLGVLGTSSIDAVVCRGMGARAVQKLNEAGIKAFRATGETAADIIKQYEVHELEEITMQNACAQHGCHS